MAGLKRRTRNQNRQQNGPTIKRLKCAEETTEPIKMADLNFDCLEKIFGNLDLDSLINIADTNTTLRAAAHTYLLLKYGQNMLWMFKHENSVAQPLVIGLKKGLQFLRCFGRVISDCAILSCGNAKYCEYLNQYLDEYCADTLRTVVFDEFPTVSQNMKNQFPKVDLVKMGNCQGKITRSIDFHYFF